MPFFDASGPGFVLAVLIGIAAVVLMLLMIGCNLILLTARGQLWHDKHPPRETITPTFAAPPTVAAVRVRKRPRQTTPARQPDDPSAETKAISSADVLAGLVRVHHRATQMAAQEDAKASARSRRHRAQARSQRAPAEN